MRWMALDHGTKRLGIAFSDANEILSTPYDVWTMDGKIMERLIKLTKEEGAQALVVGLPCHKDGQESATAHGARCFADHLARETGLPFLLWNEHLTSAEAHRMLAERGIPPKLRKEKLDAAAAALILSDLLETRRHLGLSIQSFGPRKMES